MSAQAAPDRPAPRWPLVAAAALAALAAGLSAHLAVASWRGDPAAGCLPGAEGCAAVLATRYARWAGLPVGLPAAVLFAAVAGAAGTLAAGRDRRRVAERVLLGGGLLGGAAAIWFLGLQLIAIRGFCPTCGAVHACALTIAAVALARRGVRPGGGVGAPVAAAAVGVAALVGGQLIAGAPGPRVKLLNGRVGVDPAAMPRIGPADARHVIVTLFDYTCPYCQRMEPMLHKAVKRYYPRLAVLPLVVPMDADCNPSVRATRPRHRHACRYARLALGVWHVAPQRFGRFHRWLLEKTPSLEAAKARARRRFGKAALAARDSDRVAARLRANIKLYKLVGGGRIPKVISGSTVFTGTPPSAESLFSTLERRIGIEPPAGAEAAQTAPAATTRPSGAGG